MQVILLGMYDEMRLFNCMERLEFIFVFKLCIAINCSHFTVLLLGVFQYLDGLSSLQRNIL